MVQDSQRLWVGVIAAVTAAALAGPAAAQGAEKARPLCPPGLPRLVVTGTGESRVAPDMASVQAGVTTQGGSAAEAMRQNAQRQGAVIAALTGAGIAGDDIQTSGVNLSPLMDYGENRAPAVTGYQAGNMVSVRVRDVARLGEVLDAVVAAGANEINGVSFGRDNKAGAEDDARRAAVSDARRKAEVLAEAAGLGLGPVLVLRDAPAAEGPRPLMMETRAAEDSAGIPVAAGEIATSATVQMEFALSGADCRPMRHGAGRPGDRMGGKGRGPVPDGPAAQDGAAPVPGDLPPPMGTDTGAPEPGEPLLPMGGEAPGAPAPAE